MKTVNRTLRCLNLNYRRNDNTHQWKNSRRVVWNCKKRATTIFNKCAGYVWAAIICESWINTWKKKKLKKGNSRKSSLKLNFNKHCISLSCTTRYMMFAFKVCSLYLWLVQWGMVDLRYHKLNSWKWKCWKKTTACNL